MVKMYDFGANTKSVGAHKNSHIENMRTDRKKSFCMASGRLVMLYTGK